MSSLPRKLLSEDQCDRMAEAVLERVTLRSVSVVSFRLDLPFCAHDRPRLESGRRVVLCGNCGATLDVFDTLMKFAREGDIVGRLAIQRQSLGKQVDQLKADVDRLKAQKRRAEKGAS